MKNFNDVVPIPGGQKIFVTAATREETKSKSKIIIPDGAKQIELLDVQEVIEVGLYLHAEAQNKIVTIEKGDVVRINWNSPSFYKPKKVDKNVLREDGSGVVDKNRSTEYEFTVPMFTFAGKDVLVIDKNDIDFVWKADTLSDTEENKNKTN